METCIETPFDSGTVHHSYMVRGGEDRLIGIGASPGRATGPVRIVTEVTQLDSVEPGDILVAATTSPAWTPVFATIGAVVTDVGSLAAHAAVVAREFNIPAVVATGDATSRLTDGTIVTVDGSAGTVEVVVDVDSPNRSVHVTDFNTSIIEEFRANDGKVGGNFEGAPMVILHTTGAKSGEPRTHPLVYLPDGNDWIVFASAAGAPSHPAWYRNIVAHPEITVEIGTESIPVVATEVTGPERDELYAKQVAIMAGFAEYEEKTAGIRTIPVIRLSRAS
jgi:deazaflavin-dependent oxidoreductase (nitroreductase family)